jgi:hypothetical protein
MHARRRARWVCLRRGRFLPQSSEARTISGNRSPRSVAPGCRYDSIRHGSRQEPHRCFLKTRLEPRYVCDWRRERSPAGRARHDPAECAQEPRFSQKPLGLPRNPSEPLESTCADRSRGSLAAPTAFALGADRNRTVFPSSATEVEPGKFSLLTRLESEFPSEFWSAVAFGAAAWQQQPNCREATPVSVCGRAPIRSRPAEPLGAQPAPEDAGHRRSSVGIGMMSLFWRVRRGCQR